MSGRHPGERITLVAALVFFASMQYNTSMATYVGLVAPSARDWATLVGLIALIPVAATVSFAPRAVQPRAVGVLAFVLAVVGLAFTLMGVQLELPVLATVGVCAATLLHLLASFLLIASCAPLYGGRAVAQIVLAMAAAAVANALAVEIGLGALSIVLYVVGCMCAPVLLADLYSPVLSRLGERGTPFDRELMSPRSFIPVRSHFFGCVFMYSFAFGFAMRLGEATGGVTPYLCIGVIMFVLYGLSKTRGSTGTVDMVFDVSAVLLIGGFVVSLVGWFKGASVLLTAGRACFDLLLWASLASVVARSEVGAIKAAVITFIFRYGGILAGAWTAILLFTLASAFAPPVGAVVGITMMVVVYSIVVVRMFSFQGMIEGVETDAAALPVVEIDKLADACEALCRSADLTQREAEVLRLLAQGNNATRIHDMLGISYNTVKFHVRNIYRKTDLHGQQEVIDYVRSFSRAEHVG